MLRSKLGACALGIAMAAAASCGGKSEGDATANGPGRGGSAGSASAAGQSGSAGSGGAGLCPVEIPTSLVLNSYCEECDWPEASTTTECVYPDPCVETETVTAQCAGCLWHVGPDRCEFPYCGLPGNMVQCAPDELCVIRVIRGGMLWYPGCRPNPCGVPMTPECAASVCAGTGDSIVVVNDHEVHCQCLGCS